MIIIDAINELKNENELLQYLHEEIEEKGTHKVVMQKDESNHRGSTTLALAMARQENAVALKLIEIGGKELVMEKDNWGFTAFEMAFRYNASFEVISKIIEVGGRELIMDKEEGVLSWTALKIACIHNASIEVVSKLIEIGGKELVMDTDLGLFRNTALHCACENNASTEVVSELIDIGGRELVMKKNTGGMTALHYACENNAPTEVVSKLIEIGGKDILMEKNEKGYTALYHAYFNFFLDSDENKFDDNFALMIKEGILAQVGGQFGIGGLFNTTSEDHMQYQIYYKWKDFASSLEKVMTSFQKKPPILHAALLSNAPENVICDIINRFNCILNRDVFNRYPINVAVEVGLEWDNGMEIIVNVMAAAQRRPIMYVAAQYGLQWDNHMRELTELNIDEVQHGHDAMTGGLRPFMLAAAGDHSDLNCIYELIKMNPANVCAISGIKKFMNTSVSVRCNKRRKIE